MHCKLLTNSKEIRKDEDTTMRSKFSAKSVEERKYEDTMERREFLKKSAEERKDEDGVVFLSALHSPPIRENF